jgi:hypothetical protein
MYIFNHLLNNQKKLGLKLVIIFGLILNPIFLINQANAAIGGWSLSNPVAQGASTVYDATKIVLINGKNVVKTSVVTITPTAAEVAKVLARGAAVGALTVAVEQLLGAVDWVMDPENSLILYTQIPSGECTVNNNNCDTIPKVYKLSNLLDAKVHYYADGPSACRAFKADRDARGIQLGDYVSFSTTYGCKFSISGNGTPYSYVTNPAYNPTAENDKRSLPLTTVAAQVISNAESEDAQAKAVTMAAAADIVNEAESDETKARPIATELDKAVSTATDESATGEATQTKTDPTTGEPVTETTDIALEFPTFCGWAPLVCEAAQTVISFPQTLTNWWETGTKAVTETWVAVKEWAKEETPEKENTELEIDETPPQVEQVNASFGDNVCPSMSVSWHLPYSNISLDLTPTKLCEIASGVQGFVIALGFYFASQIVGRRV